MLLGLKFATWYEYYDACPTSSVVNKGKMEQMLKSFDSTLSASEAKVAMSKNKDIVFLARTGLNKTLGLIHHVDIEGGTIVDPDEECAFIVGLDRANTIVATPDAEVLFRQPHPDAYAVAKREDIMNCSSIEDITNLVASQSQNIRARNFIPVPPFLVRTLNDSIAINKANTNQVFLDVITEIKVFDEVHKDDDDYKERAATKCKKFLQWLYVACKDNNDENGIDQIQFSNCVNEALSKRLKEFMSASLTASGTENQAQVVSQALVGPLQQLAASSRTTQEALLKLTETQEKRDSSSSEKSFSKIPESYKNMLLNASSIGEAKPSTLTNQAMEFFKLPGIKQAHVHLNSMMESKGIRVSIPHAVVNALYYGAFKWTNLATPSGFAASVLVTESYLRHDVLQTAMVLEAATKFTISDEYVDKLTKTSVQFPTTAEETIERFKAMRALASFFFPMESYITQFYIQMANWCMKNRGIIDLRVAMDTKFIAKFLVATDNRVNSFLGECMRSEMPMDVSPRWLNSRSIYERIEMGEFTYDLPSSVKTILPADQSNNNAGNDNAGVKRKADEMSIRVRNNNPVSKWKIRDNEDYAEVFKDKVLGGPILSMGVPGCHKFHNKGFCYADCTQKASHCVLAGDDFKKFDARVKALRGE